MPSAHAFKKEDGMGLLFQRREPDSVVRHPNTRRWQHLVTPPWQQPALRRGPDATAPNIDDEAILRQAKKLCAQNGAVWDASELDGAERWERNKIVIDGAGRRKYLALAREELFKESADA
jgi:hypothetical protein